jgi:hypothetical protein
VPSEGETSKNPEHEKVNNTIMLHIRVFEKMADKLISTLESLDRTYLDFNLLKIIDNQATFWFHYDERGSCADITWRPRL